MDQGSQLTSEAFPGVITSEGIAINMGGGGHAPASVSGHSLFELLAVPIVDDSCLCAPPGKAHATDARMAA